MFHAPLVKRWRIRGGVGSVKRYIAFAARKADQLHANPLGRSNLAMRLPGGVSLTIELLRQSSQALITLAGAPVGSGTYQFFGSAEYLYRTFEDPSVANRMCPIGYATLVEVRKGKVKAMPLVSSAEESLENAWTYDANPLNTDDYLTWTPHHQPDGMGNRQWFGETDLPNLATQWQQGVPLHAFGLYSGGSNASFRQVDMGFDLGVSYFPAPGYTGVNKTPDSDWYQSAATRIVEDATHGTRQFIIMVDSNNVFWCYPVGAPDDPQPLEWAGEKANVSPALTQSQACPWPVWVTQEDIGTSAILGGVSDSLHRARLRPLWHFNRDGTRAACIAAHRDSAWTDAYYDSELYYSAGTYWRDAREDYPGMVEVEFTVSLTGLNPEDFSFTVSANRDIYSRSDHQCPVAVGYALKDMGDVPENALLLLEYRHYTDTPSCSVLANNPPFGTPPPDVYDLRRPNLAAVAVVSYWDGAQWVSVRQWLAYYGCYPRRVGGVDEPRRFSPLMTDLVAGGPTYLDNHFTYIGQIMAMDMDSLSFCIAATASTVGTVPRLSGNTYTAEAIQVQTIAFNQAVQTETAGQQDMVFSVAALYGLTAIHPDIGNMTRIHLNATLSYTHYDPAWNPGNVKDYATLTVNDGALGSWSTLVQNVSEDARTAYSNIRLSGLFPDSVEIWSPKIYRFFDAWPIVRPGIRWRNTSGWQPGTLSFSGYPYAAVLHGSIAFLTLAPLNNIWHRIHTHRNGSYSYFMGPFGAQTTVLDQGGFGAPLSIPDNHYQFVMDRIALSDGKTTTLTTHIGSLNQAFGKTLTEQDFHFDISLRTVPVTGVLAPHLRPASDDPTPHNWYLITAGFPIGVLTTNQYLTPNFDLLVNAFCVDSAFANLNRHASYSSMATFPTPKMEAAWLPTA